MILFAKKLFCWSKKYYLVGAGDGKVDVFRSFIQAATFDSLVVRQAVFPETCSRFENR